MSLVIVGKNGRRYQRKFDHDKAREMRAAGLTYQRIAEELGVSTTAIQRVVQPELAKKMAEASLTRCRNQRELCRGGCGRLVWRHGTRGRGTSGYCRTCHGIHRAETVGPSTLRCSLCRAWKPDEDFPLQSKAAARRGRAGDCRACQTIRRRAHREANQETQRAYDREYQRRRRQAAKVAA